MGRDGGDENRGKYKQRVVDIVRDMVINKEKEKYSLRGRDEKRGIFKQSVVDIYRERWLR